MFKILKWFIGIVMSIVIGLGATILIVNAKYGINMIDVYKSLGRLSADVALDEIAPNAPNDEDKPLTKNKVNAVLPGLVAYDEATDTYSFSSEISGSMSEDLKLTGVDACLIVNWILDGQETGLVANIGGKDVDLKEYDFKIESIDFEINENSTVNYNVIMSISLVKIKEKMNSFPLSLLKSRVPNKLYISSTVQIEKKDGAFAYEVSSVSLALNKMTGEEVERLFKLINIVANVGEVGNFNLSLGKSFVDALIGNSETPGLAYSLRDAGATDFEFAEQDDVTYFIVKI